MNLMKKKTVLRTVLWLLVLLWAGVIFSFSMEDAEESSSTSGTLIRAILSVVQSDFDDLTLSEQAQRIDDVQFYVRKAAHFTIYTVFGFLLSAALEVDLGGKKVFLLALCIGALYAASDEIHQYFVPGRACQIRDVLIDTCGVCTGALIWKGILKTVGHFKRKRTASPINNKQG